MGSDADKETPTEHADDLRLASECVKGISSAHEELAKRIAIDVDRAWARIKPPITQDEARQLVLERLLVAPDGGAPRIGLYRGEGKLAAFVRAVATRALLNVATSAKPNESLEDSILRVTPATDPDPELQLVKQTFLAEFRAAFASAVGTLEPRERALLRYAVVEGLSVDAIGRMYGTHKATAARWVQAAREKLESRVRAQLKERLKGTTERDLASAARCVTSQLDLSLARALGD